MYKTKFSEQFVITILIALNLWICNVYSQNCKGVGSDLNLITFEILPGYKLDTPLEINVENTLEVISHHENPSNSELYFSFVYESGKVLVSTTDEFLNYERDQNQLQAVSTVKLRCSDTLTVDMYVTFSFDDTINNYAPEFTQAVYEIEIPLPLPIGVEIFSLISQQISARDNDLHNNQITFTSDISDEPFTVQTSDQIANMGKTYFAKILTTEKILNIRNGIEFKIIATDSGKLEKKSGTADVKIMAQSDDTELIEVPIFKKSLYTGTINFQQTPILDIETISLLDETFVSSIKFEMELNDDGFIKLNHNDLENAIVLTLDENIIAEDDLKGQTQLSFIITATRNDGIRGNTAVLINLIPKKSLLFEKVLYTGTIKPDMTISHDLIKLTDFSDLLDVEFSVKNDILGWFEVIAVSNVNQMEIKLKPGLTENDLKDKTLISLTISAISPGGTVLDAESHVTFGIENAEVIVPKFEQNIYEGFISTDLEIYDLAVLKLINTNIDDIQDISLSGYINLFEAVKTGDGIQIIKKSLSADDIVDKTTLQFTVAVTNDKEITGLTVIILTIDREELVAPVFQQPIYTGYLKKPFNSDSLDLENLLIDPHEGPVEFELSGVDKDLFKIETKMTNGLTLGLADGATIIDQTILTVIVLAKLTDTIVGSTVVIIQVEQDEIMIIQPKFEKNIFYGSLSQLYDLNMIDSNIKLTDTTFVDTIEFSSVGVDAKYFIVEQTANTNNIEIKLDPNTNVDELVDKTTLSFSIMATLTEKANIITGMATIVIELPKNVLLVPTFEQYLYEGSVNPDFSIDIQQIGITSETYMENTEFHLDGFDFELFDFELVPTKPGTIEISTNKITNENLKSKQLFKFNVFATNELGTIGTTSVVIEVPREPVIVVPQFEKSLYEGNLSEDLNLNILDIIKLTEDSYSSDVAFTIESGFNKDLFTILSSDNNVEIKTNGITEENLKSIPVLKIVLRASKSDTIFGSTVVLINVPATVAEQIIIPEFKQSIYHGSLPIEMEPFEILVEITDETITSEILFSITDGESDWFKIEPQNDRQAMIILTKSIGEPDIKDKKTLSLTVVATLENGLKGTSTVIIDIPFTATLLPPVFVQSLYVGSLNTALELTFTDTIMLTDESYSKEVTFELVDGFDSNFVKLSSDNENLVTFDVQGLTEDNMKSRNVLKFVIHASKSDTIFGSTVVLINVPATVADQIIIPEFKQSIYHGSLPIEMEPFEILVEITDETITSEILFSITDGESDWFKIEPQNDRQAMIILTKSIAEPDIKDKKTLSLTVVATLENGLKGTSTVIIDIPFTATLLPPVFVQSLYVGSLNTALELTFTDTIMLTDESYSKEVTFELVDGFDSNFVKLSSDNENLVTFDVQGLTEDNMKSRNVLKFVIHASKSDTIFGSTVVLINVPATVADQIIIPEFKQSIYHGSLPIEMEPFEILVEITDETITSEILFSITDGESDWFKIEPQNDRQAMIILTKSIGEPDIKDKKTLSLTVVATLENGLKGTSTVIIDIPFTATLLPPVFVQSLYVGSLNTALELTFTDTIMLTVESYSKEVTFELVDGFDSNFVKLSSDNENLVTFDVQGLTEDNMKSRNVLKFVIHASKSDTIFGSTVVLINVPATVADQIIIPEFKQSIYHGSLPIEMEPFEILVEITDETITSEILFSITDGESDWFKIEPQNDRQAMIILTKSIGEPDIKDKKTLSLTVVATLENGLKGTSTVIIDIPFTATLLPPVFVQSLYVGSLNTALELTFTDTIMLTDETYSKEVTFELVDGFDSNFVKLSSDNENLVTFDVQGLTEDNMKSRNVLKFVIHASKSDTIFGSTVVLINVPATVADQIIIPEFKQSIYHGSLPIEMEPFEILVEITDETITSEILFSITDGESDWFKIEPQNDRQAMIILTKSIGEPDIKDKKTLSLTVVATLENGLKGTSTVIIDIPFTATLLPPVFVQSLYVGSLNTALELTFTDTIMLTDETYSKEVTFELVDGFDSNFVKLSSDNENLVTFDVQGLTEDNMKSRNVLKFVIHASKSDTIFGSTVVLINVPATVADQIIIPEFKQSIYHGSLPIEMEPFEILVEITDETITSEILFSITDGESDWFKIEPQNDRQAMIILTKSIAEPDIKDKKTLSLTVVATLENGLKGTSTVIIDIPFTATLLPPVFVQSLYVGSLNTALELTFTDTIMLTDESYSKEVTFELVDGFDSNFVKLSSDNENLVTFDVQGLTEENMKSRNVLKFVIHASKSDTIFGSTVVLINVPATVAEQIIIPEFKQSIYHGSLPIEMEPFEILVEITDETITSEILFSITDGESDWFKIEPQNDRQAMIILTKSIGEPDVKDKKTLSLTVVATLENGLKGTSTVIIDIPFTATLLPPVFEQSLYVGSLNTALELTFTDTIMLTDETYSKEVTFELVDGFDSNFVKLSSDNENLVTFDVQGLTEENMKSRNVLKFVIHASKSDTIFGSTVVLINVPATVAEQIIIPEFKQSIYHGSLPIEMEPFEILVEITDETITSEILFSITDGESDWFKIEPQNDRQAMIILTKSIGEPDIKDKKTLSLTVVATLENGLKGTSTVIIDIPFTATLLPPVFVQSLYVGSLNTALELTFTDTIMLTDETYSKEVTFELVDGFDSNFVKLSSDNENLVTFDVQGLTEDNMKSRNVLKFVIHASKSDTIFGSTVVLINVPATVADQIIIPEFKQSIYHGSLPIEMEPFEILVEITDETITSEILFSITDGESDWFKIEPQNDRQAMIILTKSIAEPDIKDKKTLSLTVVATLENGLKGTSTVIIDIPFTATLLPPVFVQSLYVGSLNTALELTFTDTIMLTDESYSKEVTFELVDGFDSNFVKLSSDNENLVTFDVQGLTEENMKSRNVLKFVIHASKSDTIFGSTVVLINVPATVAEQIIIPEFKQSIYHGSLPIEMEPFEILVEITDETITSEILFSITDGESDWFKIEPQNDRQAMIILTKSIGESDIKDKKTLSLTVVATLENGLKGTSTVIIDIPFTATLLPPVFVQSLYVGSLNTALELTFTDTIMLTDESYSKEVTFELVDGFDSNFVKLSSDNENLVTFDVQGLTEDNMKSRNVLKFVIHASKSDTIFGSTVVLINVPATVAEQIIIPIFKQSIYHGSLPIEMEPFEILVEITDETITSEILFSITDGESDWFKIEPQNDRQAMIILTKSIGEPDIKDKKTLSLTVVATLENGLKGTSTVIIDIPFTATLLPPVFEQSLYVGSLNTALELTFTDTIMLTDETYSKEVTFELVDGYDHDLFEIESNTELNSIALKMKDVTYDMIKSKSALKIVISATNTKTNQIGTTVVVVEIKSTIVGETIIPKFEQPLYVGVLTTDLKINIGPIKIAMETYSNDISIGWHGDDSNLFDYDKFSNEIYVKTIRDLTENDLENKKILSLIISASLPTGEKSSTVVQFDIPFEGCKIPNDDTKPKFGNQYYLITIEPNTIGAILTVYADVPNDPSIKVIYDTKIDDAGLSSKIEMTRDTGKLSLTDPVPPGIYNFIVTALNPNDNSIGYASIKLTVTSVIYCSNEPTVSHSLVVKHLEEEIPHSDIFDTQITKENCQYRIVTVTPNSLANIFKIEENRLISQSFDRESLDFKNMLVPQISLIIAIYCDKAPLINEKYKSIAYNQTRTIRSTKDDIIDNNYYVYTNDISRDDDKTIITIIIKDINDNWPVFEYPVKDILIGYPESQLAEKLLPPYLIKVYATDIDEGINAKIAYTIDSNPHFGINRETGIVHPLKNAMDDVLQYDLVVKAIDEDGTGKATSLNIKVKRLEEKHFIVISIENEILANLDTILADIEKVSGIKINVLNAAIVSTATQNVVRAKRSVTPFVNNEETVLQIIGYAFNADDEPIENDVLETTLSEVTTVYIITTQNLVELIGDCTKEDTTCPPIEQQEQSVSDDTGFIVGITIVALLLLLALIAIFVMWWRFIRPYRYIKRDSITEKLETDFNGTSYTEPVVAPISTITNSDMIGKSNFEIQNENAPTQTSKPVQQSSPATLAKSLQSVLDMDSRKTSVVLDKDNLSGSSETDDNSSPPLRERKKSIKFNEMVERIDILDDVTEKEDTTF